MAKWKVVVGVGVILVLGIFWALFLSPMEELQMMFVGMSSDEDSLGAYSLIGNVYYFCYFFISLLIFVWIFKKDDVRAY